MVLNVIEPKYFMLNCKYIVPGTTYESYLIEVVNSSEFFLSKRSFMEHYKLVKEQSNGEDDAYTSTYQLDFKLIVDENVMRERNKNKPDINYSNMAKGFIFVNTKEKVSDIPDNNILLEIMKCQSEEIKNGTFQNNTIKSLVKNLGKKKNIFMYYPYEFSCNIIPKKEAFENMLTEIFKVLLEYREISCAGKDTFICIKVNNLFLIFEWADKKFIYRDNVNEFLCSNYLDAKTYSLY